MGVVDIEIQVPQPPKKVKVVGNLKKKATASNKISFAGTSSGHYLSFIKKTLDQMYRCPEMKEFYLIVDNSPIHDKKKDSEIEKITESRDYQGFYIPLYFSELNPIEQF